MFTARQWRSESVTSKDCEKLRLRKLDHITLEEMSHVECFTIRTKTILNGMWWNTKQPNSKAPYRTPYALWQEMKNKVQKILDKQVI